MWWNHDYGWAGWLAMSLMMIGFWLLIAVLLVAGVRTLGGPRDRTGSETAAPTAEALRILDERLERDEIDIEEYQTLRRALTGSGR